jgi:phosphodiesterase/alkaline phosphatase D-like protein
VEWRMDDVKDVLVPARGALPRCAFFSCNGLSEGKGWATLDRPFALWEEMRRQQEQDAGFHVLIGGGDQLYTDSLWYTNPALVRFQKLSREQRQRSSIPDGLEAELLRDYVEVYRERWNEHGIGPLLARVPGLFTWDDHDIMDGWGSLEDLQGSPTLRALYSAAALVFEAFQLGVLRSDVKARREPGAAHYFQAITFSGEACDLDVVMLDLRSGRTSRGLSNGKVDHTILSDEQWRAFDTWRKEHAVRAAERNRPRHVLVVSSIPIVFMRFRPGIESGAALVDKRDDLLDQWESGIHRGERTRLMMNLFELAKDSCCAVTVLSGDSHVASRALIRSRNMRHLHPGHAEVYLEQVTSSGIVHPPPSVLELMGMRALANDVPEDLPGHLRTELLPVGGDLYLRERNWLSLRFAQGKEGRSPKLWLKWEAEHSHIDVQVVVDPPSRNVG